MSALFRRCLSGWLIASVILYATLFSAAGAETNRPRLAIIAEGAAAPFADLLTASFSSAEGVQVVERAELDRLAGEASLAALSAEQRPLAAARLAGAQALLFVRQDITDRRNIMVLRMSAVADGTVLHSLVLPWVPAEMAANAKLATRQFLAPLAQLHGAGKPPTTVSLLGLRSALDSTRLSGAEVTLNTLLAHRLTMEPGFSVLERWRMDDLVFERALEPLVPAAEFKTGGLLIDGSFTKQDTGLVLRLRTRKSLTDSGTTRELIAADPGALADSILATLRDNAAVPGARPGRVRPWQPAEEAQAYLDLGEWLLKFRLYAEAAQAMETAVALGLTDNGSRSRRIWAYGQCAYPDNGTGYSPLDQGYFQSSIPTREEIPYRLSAARRSLEYALDLVSESSRIEPAAALGSAHAFYKTVRLLRGIVAARAQSEFAEPVAATRALLGQLIAKLDRTVVRTSFFYLNYKANYAAYWCDTPEETLAYYRRALAPDYAKLVKQSMPLPYSMEVRDTLFDRNYSAPYLDRAPKRGEEMISLGAERLVNWQNPDSPELRNPWEEFLRDLRRDADLTTQADSMGFELTSHVDPANRQRLQTAMVTWLWTNRASIAQMSATRLFSSMRLDVEALAREPQNEVACGQLVEFLVEVLGRSDWLPMTPYKWMEQLGGEGPRSNLTTEQARTLAKAFGSYAEKKKKDPRWNFIYQAAESRASDVLNRFAAKAPPVPPLPVVLEPIILDPTKLPVTRAWVPARQLADDSGATLFVNSSPTERPVAVGNRVFLNTSKGIAVLNPQTQEATLTPPLEGPTIERTIHATKREIWAADRKTAMRIPWEGGQWQKLELPEASYTFYSAGDRLFLWGRPRNMKSVDGMTIHEVLPSGPRLIMATRRIPPVHPLDTIHSTWVRGIFAGPKHETWIGLLGPTMFDGPIHSLDQPEAGAIMQVPKWTPRFKTDGPVTLMTEYSFKVSSMVVSGMWLVDPAKEAPELLLHDSGSSLRPESAAPRWKTPELLRDPEPGVSSRCSPVMHAGELWILRWHQIKQGGRTHADHFELHGFFPGRLQPVRVPLQLIPSLPDRAALGDATATALTKPDLVDECLTTTDYGLIIAGHVANAVWIVPWEDLRAWVKVHP